MSEFGVVALQGRKSCKLEQAWHKHTHNFHELGNTHENSERKYMGG